MNEIRRFPIVESRRRGAPLHRWASVLFLGAAAAVVSFWGIGARDIAPDELFFQNLSPRQVEEAAVDPVHFTGHMPLSYLARWGVQQVMDPNDPASFRVHAALAACLASLLVWGTVRRRVGAGWALVAGLMVAFSPILNFHAHESSDYAASALLGAVTLEGALRLAEGGRGGGILFGLGLLLGLHNGLFFVFSAAGMGMAAILASPSGARRRETQLTALLASLPTALLLGGQASWFLAMRAGKEGGGLTSGHADPVTISSLVDAVSSLLRQVAVTYRYGYESRLTTEPWDVVPALTWLALPLLVGGMVGNRSALRVGAEAVVWTLALFILVHQGFSWWTGTAFATGARVFLGLLPALCVTAVLACAQAGRWGAVAAGCLLVSSLLLTSHQLATLSQRDSLAASLIARHAQPGDSIWAPDGVRRRLAPSLRARALSCGNSLPPPPQRLWVVRTLGSHPPLRVEGCRGQIWEGDSLPFSIACIDHFHPPPYEAHSASYFSTHQVLLLEPQEGKSPAARRGDRPADKEGAVSISGRQGQEGSVVSRPLPPEGGAAVLLARIPVDGEIHRGWSEGRGGAMHVEVRDPWPSWAPRWLPVPLADRAEGPLISFGPRGAVCSGVEPVWELEVPRDLPPKVREATRPLLALGALALVGGLPRIWRRRRSTP